MTKTEDELRKQLRSLAAIVGEFLRPMAHAQDEYDFSNQINDVEKVIDALDEMGRQSTSDHEDKL